MTATASAPTIRRPPTKAQVWEALSKKSGISRKQVAGVFGGLSELIKAELGKKGTGKFTIPGLLKLEVSRKPATRAGQKLNPFTKEMITVAAKPARNVIKARPLKGLKEMV